jgi:quercetin dioxygenase-like cupin family protein
MTKLFPVPVKKLPLADIPVEGLTAYLSQGDDHQILFMEFSQDAEVPEHSHEGQYAIVLEGRVDMVIDEEERTFLKGDRYYIPEGVKHSAKVHRGYADITFFDQADRYSVRDQALAGRGVEPDQSKAQ